MGQGGQGGGGEQGWGTHTMNSDRLQRFHASSVRIMSAKAFPQSGSFSSMRVSLQPPAGGHPPGEGTAMGMTQPGTWFAK